MNQLNAILSLLIPKIIELISKNENLSEIEASKQFYCSKVYKLLEDEKTQMWHFSEFALYQMFLEEKKQGEFYIPEGIL